MSVERTQGEIYGLMAEFDDADRLIDAAAKAREAGYRQMDGYSPIPVHGLYEAMGRKRTILPSIVLLGAILGGLGGFMLQYWVSVIEYPLNIGGRPYFSWPSFFPVTFECSILGAALATLIGLLGLNRLPEPYHPVFNAKGFERATDDRFFLCIESGDEKFDRAETRRFLDGLKPLSVSEVEW